MIFNDLIKSARTRMEKRARYNRMVDEIHGLTQRDLNDMGANRHEMLHHVYMDVYGSR